jgi:branched-chain amino acid transport system permease protein
MFMLQSLLLSGIAVGLVYSFVAMGYNVVLNSSKILNLCQGEFVMIGALLASVLGASLGIPLVFAYLLAIVGAIVFGIALKVAAITPLTRRDAPLVSLIIITLAVTRLVSEGANVFSGGMMRSVTPIFGNKSIMIGSLYLPPQILSIMVIGLVLSAGLWYFFERTTLGLAMSAVAINKEAAQLMGISYNRVVLLSFIMAAFVGGIGGVMLGQWQAAYPHMGLGVGIKGFAAAVVGGIGNWWGGLLGGLLIGICEALASGYVSTAYADSIAAGIMILVLWLKPEGLLPSRL